MRKVCFKDRRGYNHDMVICADVMQPDKFRVMHHEEYKEEPGHCFEEAVFDTKQEAAERIFQLINALLDRGMIGSVQLF